MTDWRALPYPDPGKVRTSKTDGKGGWDGQLDPWAKFLASVLLTSTLMAACSGSGDDSSKSPADSGGANAIATGGVTTGGALTGGEQSSASQAGDASGAATGSASGGTGGSSSGGAMTSGGATATGGVTTGSGGSSATGGVATGGVASGGSSATGGVTTGGTANGGATLTGGSDSGGAGGTVDICTIFSEPTVVGTIESSALGELSGLVASRSQPGVLYAHSDSGEGAVFHAMSTSGAALGQYTLVGASATDWEDIAVGPGPTLYIADTGDNAARTGGAGRSSAFVFRLPEPTVSLSQSPVTATITDWEQLEFTYPDAAHDCETLMVDPVTGDLVFVTKEDDGASTVFRAPGTVTTGAVTQLEAVASLQLDPSGTGAHATAGDFSPNGDRILLRTYPAIRLWTRPEGVALTMVFASKPTLLPQPTEPQGEGLTFSADGLAWFAAGERESAIYSGVATCE